MESFFPAIRDLRSGIARWVSNKAAQRAARSEAKAWVKALPEGFVADLVAKVPMPDHLWATTHYVLNQDTNREAPAIYQAYVDEHFAGELKERRVALAEALMAARYRQWSNHPAVQELTREHQTAFMADRAARDEAHRARVAAMAPNPNSLAGMKAQAEKNARAGVGYCLNTGRELTNGERLQLGLPSALRKPAQGSLLDGHGLK